jgi:hypothetical protein
MASKTKKTRSRRESSAAEAADKLLSKEEAPQPALPLPVLHEKLTEEERALFDQASDELAAVEQRMTALTRAAASRWRAAQSVYDTDETSALVFSDEEYADFLAVVEMMGEAEMLRTIGCFVGLPVDILDDIVHEKLKGKLVPMPRKALPFVIKQSRQREVE